MKNSLALQPLLAALLCASACGCASASEAAAPAESLSEIARGSAARGLAFQEARALLRGRSDRLRASEAELEARQQAAEADRSLSQPKVVVNTQYDWGTKTIDYGTLDVGGAASRALSSSPALGQALQGLPQGLREGLSGLRIPLHAKTDLDGPRVTLEGYWPIYTGGRIEARQKASEAAAREAKDSLQNENDRLDTELARKYFAVQLARSITKLREEALEDQEREVRRARGFERAGTVSRLERLSVEVNRDKARRELLAAQSDQKVAEAELGRLLREGSLGGLSTPLFVLRGPIDPLRRWQDQALASSPVLAAYGAKTEQAEQLLRAARGAWKPTLYAFGAKNVIKHYLTLTEPDWIAGVGVSYTLWNNRDRNASIASARATRAKAEAGTAEARNQLLTGVEVAWLRTTQMQSQYELTRSTVDLAAENLRMRESAFATGLSTANEVWDARTKLTGARVEQKVAAYRFVVAWAELNSAAGTMERFSESLERSDKTIEK